MSSRMFALLRPTAPLPLLALAFALLAASGCSNGRSAAPEAEPVVGYHSPISMGEVVSGETEPHSFEPDYGEFQAPTGKWITGGGIGVSISAGFKRPGEPAEAWVQAVEPGKTSELADRAVRYKLTERDRNDAYVRTVEENLENLDSWNGYTGFRVKLPEKAGVRYYFSVEILHGSTVEDTAASVVEVPVQEVAADLALDRAVYPADAEIVVRLVNRGRTTLFYGLDYRLERDGEDGWTGVPAKENTGVPAIGIQLSSGLTWEQSIRIADLAPGIYRVSKTVEGMGTPIERTLNAEFRVE